MKEATGELNMTVITVVAIAAIAALFYAFVWPMIQRSIVQQTCEAYGPDYVAKELKSVDSGNENNKSWQCCNEKTNKCIDAN